MRSRLSGRAFQLGAALALLAILVGGLVACGGQGAAQAPGGAQKPTGAGTPISGVAPTLITNQTGHYESLITAAGVTFVGSDNGPVYAFRASTGALLWRYDTGANATLYAVDASAAYVVSGAAGDSIYVLRVGNGKLLWQRHIESDGGGPLSVVVGGGVVFASVNTIDADGVVYALRATDGAQLWRWSALVALPEPMTTADGAVYFQAIGKQNAALDALRTSDGKLLWSYPIGSETSAPVTVGGVTYVFNGQTEVDAVQNTTGQRLWRFTCDADQNFGGGSTLTVADGVVYAPAISRVYALRTDDGRPLWSANRYETTSATPDQMVVSDGAVYGMEGQGGVFALRVSDGALLWSQNINNSVMGLVAEQGRVDVATQLDVVYTLRASDGKLLWSRAVDHFNTWLSDSLPYIVVAGAVYVGTDRGVVQAIRASDGALLWRYAIPPKAVPTTPVYSAGITFAPSITYQAALRIVTDLGLQSIQPCGDLYGAWKPMNAGASWSFSLVVLSTPISPLGWLTPLGKTAGVTQVQPNPVTSCPAMGNGPLAPGVPTYLPANQAGTLARITFSAQTSYDSALTLVSALGFRLGDPCYERQPQGAHIQWTPMGQESAYASAHTLLVVTTPFNSTQWQTQAQTSAGVTSVQVAPTVTCGKQ